MKGAILHGRLSSNQYGLRIEFLYLAKLCVLFRVKYIALLNMQFSF
jgi:hypothetical protein